MKLTVDHLTIPKQGEPLSGDAVVVRVTPGHSLLAVVDALGHGPLAAEVAAAASQFLASVPLERGARDVIEGLHQHLKGSRGAAAMICVVTGARLVGCGVGNVELRSLGARIPCVLTPGVLGGQVNRLRVFEADLAPGDRLVLFSDGISSRVDLAGVKHLGAADACQSLMRNHRHSHDDSTVLVADCGP